MTFWKSLAREVQPRVDALKQSFESRVEQATPHLELDEQYRERACDFVEKLGSYFDPEVRGLSRLPVNGPYMLVGNHSGGAYTPDAPIFMAALLRHWGMSTPIRPLAHNILFGIPKLATTLRRLGAMPASPKNAAAALDRGEIVLVYPGGDYESQRPFLESHLVDFNGRKGFIRLALEKGIPVIPFVCHGSNETVITVTRGEALARATMLTHITRSKVLPLRLSFPFGLLPSGIPHFPLPSKITIEVGHPMAWQDFAPEDAQHPELVQALYDDIVSTMQRTLHGLYVERPNPYKARKQRIVEPQHSPAPAPPHKALALRVRPVTPPVELEKKRHLRSVPSPRRTSAA